MYGPEFDDQETKQCDATDMPCRKMRNKKETVRFFPDQAARMRWFMQTKTESRNLILIVQITILTLFLVQFTVGLGFPDPYDYFLKTPTNNHITGPNYHIYIFKKIHIYIYIIFFILFDF